MRVPPATNPATVSAMTIPALLVVPADPVQLSARDHRPVRPLTAGATALDRIERLRATLAEFNGLKGSSIKEDAGLRSAIKSMMHDSRKLYFFIWFYAYYEDS